MSTLKPTPTLLVIVGVAFCLKIVAVLTLPGYIGVDGGAYLLSLWAWLGHGQIADFARPPFAPGYLLWPFVTFFGMDIGLKLFHVFASMTIIYPFWLFARLYLRQWPAVIATVFIMMDWQMTELFVVGALPSIGFALILLAMWAIQKRMTEYWPKEPANKRYFMTLVFSIPAIAFVNQTSVGMALIILPAFIVSLYLLNKGSVWPLIKPLTIGTVLALAALPWYINVTPGSSLLRYPGPLIALSGDAFHWYYMTIAFCTAAFAWFWSTRRVKALTLFVLVFVAMSPWVSYDETVQNIFWRSRYFMMIPTTIVIIWLMDKYASLDWGNRMAAYGIGVMAFALIFGGAVVIFLHVSRYTQMVTPATARAIEYINGNGGGKVIGNHYSMALYVAALTEEPVAWTQIAEPPPAYSQQHMLSLCVLGWAQECNPLEAAHTLQATYVLAETRWPTNEGYGRNWLAPEEAWELTEAASWLEKVYQEGSTVLWRIAP